MLQSVLLGFANGGVYGEYVVSVDANAGHSVPFGSRNHAIAGVPVEWKDAKPEG